MNGASTQIPQVGSGGCTDGSTTMSNNMIIITCNIPNTSILFDGVVPSDITDRERQLLHLNSHSNITFYVSSNISTFEIIFLNCPSSNTGTGSFVVWDERNRVAAAGLTNGVTSCEYFLKLCVNAAIPIMNKFTLQPRNPQADIYIAEIVLHNNGVCNTSNPLVSINDPSTVPSKLNISLLYIIRKKIMSKNFRLKAMLFLLKLTFLLNFSFYSCTVQRVLNLK